MNKKGNLRIIIPVVLSVFVLLYGANLLYSSSDTYEKINRGLKLFGQVYKQVSTTYVDEIDPETFVEAAIKGMLDSLDPYTSYISPENSENLNMMTSGTYGGVGIKLGIRGDSLTVISPMEGTPASRGGILSGDKIIKIDSVFSKSLKLDKAADMIRGPEGKDVILSIYRRGFTEPIDFTLKREKIVINEIVYTGYIKEGIGYIRLSGFSKSSVRKFKEALEELEKENLESIIIDLRDNPGGLLESALRISDMFIDKKELLVSTKGRVKQMNVEHYSKIDPLLDKKVKLVVLVNGGSASASEIFAGVMQDLDRGVIVGSKTFGKGLVQSLLNLPYDRKVKVTTGKYYIPSGRLIQKEDYFHNDNVVIRNKPDSLFVTSNGRFVYGGGGITPDIEIKYPIPNKIITHLWRKNMFYRYSTNWVSSNPDATAPLFFSTKEVDRFLNFVEESDFEYKSEAQKTYEKLITLLESGEYTDELINEVKNLQIETRSLKDIFSRDDINNIARVLSREISERIGKTEGRYRAIFSTDEAILKSIHILEEDSEYHNTLRSGS
ncbi:MAG: PDZ domain-containing protein [Candidatus Marinimicrobia bacterium]|nr:PDZ domain-containing protein [Candidatus Neomarinimicrobiota bacterium]